MTALRIPAFALLALLASLAVPFPQARGADPQLVHTFPDNTVPNCLIQGSDGNFYGTIFKGPDDADGGSVFRITPDGTFTTLHTFYQGDDVSLGHNPLELIQGGDGNFYGVTAQGAGGHGQGAVFKMTPAGVVTLVHAFDTGSPALRSLVYGADGSLYGALHNGRTADSYGGALYRIAPNSDYTEPCQFSQSSGIYGPYNLVPGGDGVFYCLADNYYSAGNRHSLIRINVTGSNPPAATAATLLTFDTPPNSFDSGYGGQTIALSGPCPSRLIYAGGDLYGIFPYQHGVPGQPDVDSIFKLDADGNLTNMGPLEIGNGWSAFSTLIRDGNGNFYGCDQYPAGLFKVDAAGKYSCLFSTYPARAVMQAQDGSLYILTVRNSDTGGDVGEIYRVDPGVPDAEEPPAPSATPTFETYFAPITAYIDRISILRDFSSERYVDYQFNGGRLRLTKSGSTLNADIEWRLCGTEGRVLTYTFAGSVSGLSLPSTSVGAVWQASIPTTQHTAAYARDERLAGSPAVDPGSAYSAYSGDEDQAVIYLERQSDGSLSGSVDLSAIHHRPKVFNETAPEDDDSRDLPITAYFGLAIPAGLIDAGPTTPPAPSYSPAKLKLKKTPPRTTRAGALALAGTFTGGKGRQTLSVSALPSKATSKRSFPGAAWTAKVKLQHGRNTITLRAIDLAGKKGPALVLHVTRQ